MRKIKGLNTVDDQSGEAKTPDLISKPTSAVTPAHKTPMDVIGENFDSIVSLAKDYIDLQKIKVKSQEEIARMEADRKALLAEAEVYAIKKDRDLKDKLQKMQTIREMMADYYAFVAQFGQPMSPEAFHKTLDDIVNQIKSI